MKIIPTLEHEERLWNEGFRFIGGIDEAGRGCWAGPVVAAVVILPKDHEQISGITDSKLISEKKRNELYELITSFALDFGVGIISHRIVDQVGILNATKLAAKEAVSMTKNTPDYLLTDALDLRKQIDIKQELFVKGDQKIYTISCASIVAKVTRDNLMRNLSGEYKKYQFNLHKGYGTALHTKLLDEYGICDIHRKSYKPIKKYL
jgi:ribonuclease HII